MYWAMVSARAWSSVVKQLNGQFRLPEPPGRIESRADRVAEVVALKPDLFVQLGRTHQGGDARRSACDLRQPSPYRTRMRFSSTSGTTSATVPIAARPTACSK